MCYDFIALGIRRSLDYASGRHVDVQLNTMIAVVNEAVTWEMFESVCCCTSITLQEINTLKSANPDFRYVWSVLLISLQIVVSEI
jgi:hypothetical protein